MDTNAIYREEQRFRQKWLWAILLATVLIEFGVAVLFAHGMVQQLVRGQPWGNAPMSDARLATFGSIMILQGVVVGVGLPWLFHAMKLITEVTPDGLCVHFFPFYRRRIPFERIRHCEARTYRPVAEYGGWGIRWGFKGTAYNVSGNRGVQLDLVGSRPLLIGSQRADDLARAIQAGIEQKP
jgi:hypothetical protein